MSYNAISIKGCDGRHGCVVLFWRGLFSACHFLWLILYVRAGGYLWSDLDTMHHCLVLAGLDVKESQKLCTRCRFSRQCQNKWCSNLLDIIISIVFSIVFISTIILVFILLFFNIWITELQWFYALFVLVFRPLTSTLTTSHHVQYSSSHPNHNTRIPLQLFINLNPTII